MINVILRNVKTLEKPIFPIVRTYNNYIIKKYSSNNFEDM